MVNKTRLTVVVAFFCWAAPFAVIADNTNEMKSGYNKSGQFLPGESVKTPEGQKIKMWSTAGPVPVSQAPDPYQNSHGVDPSQIGVVVEHDGYGRHSQESSSAKDSFDMRDREDKKHRTREGQGKIVH